MLTLQIVGREYFNEETEEFDTLGDFTVELEHSLVSLSKWESIHNKPFLSEGAKTPEEILSYVECMISSPNHPSEFRNHLTNEYLEVINTYIESRQTATSFGEMPSRKGRGEVITSELVYYWMVAFNIPFECETWHLNRLFSLIRICNIKNAPAKKMSRSEVARRNRELNEKRRSEMGTNG
jgi:hypothetical protein